MDLVIATRNERKCREIKELLRGLDIEVKSLSDFPGAPHIEEDGNTFEENATKKAVGAARFTKKLALADDSGLEVEALGKEPGIHSARFAGKEQNDEANIAKLLKLMEGVPRKNRGARFRCCVAIAEPSGAVKVAEGSCEGSIGLKPQGSYGFGYDPVFVVPDYSQTFAQLDPEIKNKISHRARALEKAKKIISEYLRSQGS